MSKRSTGDFEPHFEGRALLDSLLEVSGGTADTLQSIAVFQEALQAGKPRNEVIPSLFAGEPRPPNPELARKLFENLLGLWTELEQGRDPLRPPSVRTPREKPEMVPPPGRFQGDAPSSAYVKTALHYMTHAGKREHSRWQDAFENRHDALLSYLDDSALPDEGYSLARRLSFELFVVLELGVPGGTRGLRSDELSGKTAVTEDAPPSLVGYVDEALVGVEDSQAVRERVIQGLRALWHARNRGSHVSR